MSDSKAKYPPPNEFHVAGGRLAAWSMGRQFIDVTRDDDGTRHIVVIRDDETVLAGTLTPEACRHLAFLLIGDSRLLKKDAP